MNNSVELLGWYGDDLMVANVARVSYGKNVEMFGEKEEKLLNYLVKHKHTSPFRHPQLQFRITCPLYVERQLFKHQVGLSANSISGRYVDFSDSYTTVKKWRKQSTSSKQGSEGELDALNQKVATDIENKVIVKCKKAYDALLKLGVSKEQARTVLPLSLNTTFIWTGSLLAFLHLFDLRTKPDTQEETREIAKQMVELVKNIDNQPFKHTLHVWGY